MSERSEIERLERELQQRRGNLQQRQQNCNHKWNPTIYEPEDYQEPSFSHYEGHGSDPNPVYRYSTRQKPRWSRYCPVCEKKEYTYEQKPAKYEPAF